MSEARVSGTRTTLGEHAPATAALSLTRHMAQTKPRLDAELARWQRRAAAIPDAELRLQALASLRAKRFHCEGASVYALEVPEILPAIVALQTISDYLDNLADRSSNGGEADLRLLHLAFIEAMDPSAPATAYYALHAHAADGGYLSALVRTCQEVLERLPGWTLARAEARCLAGWYADLQVLKHLARDQRQTRVRAWAANLPATGLAWWEAAAAAGSTLGLFALFEAAADPTFTAERAQAIRRAYFPWVTALHILLDYWIDLDEDRRGGDLNFAAFYTDATATSTRLAEIFRRARQAVQPLPHARFHQLVVSGLPATYLTDPKIRRQRLTLSALRLLARCDKETWLFWWLVRTRLSERTD